MHGGGGALNMISRCCLIRIVADMIQGVGLKTLWQQLDITEVLKKNRYIISLNM